MKKLPILVLGLSLTLFGQSAPKHSTVKKEPKMVSADLAAGVYYTNGCPTQQAKLTSMKLSEAKQRGFKSKKCK